MSTTPQVFLSKRVILHVGDCLSTLAAMDADSVDCVVTSPPYWGLRDYDTGQWVGGDDYCQHERVDTRRTAWANSVKGPGNPGKNGKSYANMTKFVGGRCAKCSARWIDQQIGMEPTLGEHLEVMVQVFEAVRRVLKPTGTCWINYGDCYATSPNGRSAADTKAAGGDDRTFRDKPFSTVGPIYVSDYEKTERSGQSANKGSIAASHGGRVVAGGRLKPKDLCMVPNRLAIALQEAGWWVRSEIVWAKPNPMPESVVDRPATSHEKIFMLTKSARYFYDAEAVRQNRVQDEDAKTFRGGSYVAGEPGARQVNGNKRISKQDQAASSAAAAGASSGRRMAGFNERWDAKEKLRASDLADPRHAGHINHTKLDETPRGFGRNLRNYEPAPLGVWNIATQPFTDAHFATFPPELAKNCILAGCPKGGIVLDPFGGAGTTALVALRHGRRAALIELSEKYAAMARRRIEREWRVISKAPVEQLPAGPLFGAVTSEAAE